MGVYNGVILGPTIMRNYICALIDAAFGLWKAPGHCLLHSGYDHKTWAGVKRSNNQSHSSLDSYTEIHPYSFEEPGHWALLQETIPRCLHDGLYFWEGMPPQPDSQSDDRTASDVRDSASVSLGPMDARTIVGRLPFRFKGTHDLNKHLTFRAGDKETILIFTDWRRFLMLRHHKVLIDDASPHYPKDQVSRFQLLARNTRTGEERIGGSSVDVRGIAYELLQTYSLLFYRKISDEKDARGELGEFYDEARPLMPAHLWWWICRDPRLLDKKLTSETIAKKDIGLDVESSPGFDQLVKILAHPDNSVPQSADFKIF